MKAVKYLSIFFLIAYCCISCEETVNERLQILIQNRTDSSIHITLFPQKAFTGMTYLPCEEQDCGGQMMEFVLHPNNNGSFNWDEIIFSTHDLKVESYTLASKAFDSIYIRRANEDNVIKFTHEKVTGYSENIFSEKSTWDFDIREQDFQDFFNKHPQRYYQYKFLILKDKVSIE